MFERSDGVKAALIRKIIIFQKCGLVISIARHDSEQVPKPDDLPCTIELIGKKA
jgi:hypothetical protein